MDGLPISVTFRQGLVSIVCDTSLWLLADRRKQDDMRRLVYLIYDDHQRQFGLPLAITQRSFIFEIRGHIYADYYLLRYASFFQSLFGKRLYARLLQSCEEIDCGDQLTDPNRRFWDITSVFAFACYPFFPRNIARKYAKEKI